MKLRASFGALVAVLGGVLPRAVLGVTTHPCPPAGTTSILPAGPPDESVAIRLPVVSNPDGLCVLLRRSSIDGSGRAHVARSYAGRGWERNAGPFASSASGVVVDCVEGSEHECDVVLPPLASSGEEYVLESREHATSAEGEAARFLEQATFGGTLDEIRALAAAGNDFASWVHDQVNVKPPSTLRAFYRRHANPKFEFPYNIGAVSSLPCQLHSRWRRYAITSRDCLQERKTGRQKHLKLVSVSGVGYVWYVDDQFRTVTANRPTYGWGNTLRMKLNFRYRIGSTNGANWRADCVG